MVSLWSLCSELYKTIFRAHSLLEQTEVTEILNNVARDGSYHCTASIPLLTFPARAPMMAGGSRDCGVSLCAKMIFGLALSHHSRHQSRHDDHRRPLLAWLVPSIQVNADIISGRVLSLASA